MAIDSETKRRSVHGYTMTPIYPVADGSVDTQDRPHVAWIYSGLIIASLLQITIEQTLYILQSKLDSMYVTQNDEQDIYITQSDDDGVYI